MSTRFTFPKDPKIGDKIEVVAISQDKLPIELYANSEAEKPLRLLFPDRDYTATAGGSFAYQITGKNISYFFRCVSVKDEHVWLLGDTVLYSYLASLEARVAALES